MKYSRKLKIIVGRYREYEKKNEILQKKILENITEFSAHSSQKKKK